MLRMSAGQEPLCAPHKPRRNGTACCQDSAPKGRPHAAQVQAGKCKEAVMIANNFCALSCGRCTCLDPYARQQAVALAPKWASAAVVADILKQVGRCLVHCLVIADLLVCM
jgi:hypothetical protein